VSNLDDDGGFLRVVNIPARGVGGRTAEVLQASAQQRGISLWQAACSTPLSGKAAQGVAEFVRLIEALRVECTSLSLAETVELVVERSGLKGHYQGERDGQDRIENLDELVNAAAGFQSEGSASTAAADAAAVNGDSAPDNGDNPRLAMLDEFLSHAALEAGEHQAAAGAEALQLMTVHSAKGLEFDAVFISGLEEGLFPHENSLNEGDGVEEERRLMYVAITRARTWLYLSHAQTRMLHGHTRYNIPSRFLHEIPAPLMRKLGVSLQRGYGTARASATVIGYNTQEPASPWRVGQDVLHPKFGPGTIVSVQGRGADTRVMVNFRQSGMKELAVEYAKLTAA
jgi:DNA helicase II / ATP-dependent DNA helicase PcrA